MRLVTQVSGSCGFRMQAEHGPAHGAVPGLAAT